MKNNKIDFSAQTLYVGIDAHKKNWQITIILNGMTKGKDSSADLITSLL